MSEAYSREKNNQAPSKDGICLLLKDPPKSCGGCEVQACQLNVDTIDELGLASMSTPESQNRLVNELADLCLKGTLLPNIFGSEHQQSEN